MPFILGFFFSYLIYPFVKTIMNGLNKIKKNQGMKAKKIISILLAYVVVIGIITVVIIYIFPQLRDSGKEIGTTIKKGYNYMIAHEDEVNAKIPYLDISNILDYIKENGPEHLMNYSTNIVPYVYQLSSSVVSSVYNVLIGLVVSIYLVIDGKNLIIQLKKLIYAISPKGKEKGVWNVLMKCNHIFNGFLFGKMIDSLIIGVLCLMIMSILRLPFAVLLSVIVGITNMIPYFGPFIGAIPGVVIFLFIDPKLSLIFAIMIFVLQQFDGLYLGPKILGDLTGIKPLWVIFGVTVGGALFGVMGMFLGVPTVAVFSYLINLILEKKLKKKGISSEDII
jgi:predicted PurR-regulated permease PerM